MPPALPAFSGYGIELEHMIVDAATLDVMPVADTLLDRQADIDRGRFGWSNEIVLHLVELRNGRRHHRGHPRAIRRPLGSARE